jgi:tRNA dimethylallyltransferase
MGPTASGKTALAIALAEALDGELVSVDSALVYRGLDIGAAKPAYPHHLIDICDPSEAYSAARFVSDARRALRDIVARGRRPILVGGTMLYYRALLQGLSPLPEADPELRAALEARARREGWPELHRELQRVDPEAAARIHPNHSQRLLRALEVWHLTGRRLSALHREAPPKSAGLRALPIALAPADRAVLHERIELRLTQMLEAGFVEEVARLYEREDLHPRLPAIRAVGYRQLWDHVAGQCTLEVARDRALAATRQLAKRQFTWLRKWPGLRWLQTDAHGLVIHSELSNGPAERPSTNNPADLVLNYLRSNPM